MAFKKGQGGRPKGVPNKATADLKALAQPYTDEALRVIVSIMRKRKAQDNARLAAASAVLDRAYGKPPQAHTGDGGGPIAVTTTVNHLHSDDDAGGH